MGFCRRLARLGIISRAEVTPRMTEMRDRSMVSNWVRAASRSTFSATIKARS